MILWDKQSKLIYSLIVAGKNARFADEASARLLKDVSPSQLPFDYLRSLIKSGQLSTKLLDARTGNYKKLEKAFRAICKAKLDLDSCSPADLEQIPGIGPKTSRFFILWIRPNEKYAALDVHVLRWLRSLGYSAPESTPIGKQYQELEKIFLIEAQKRNKNPRELDLEIWAIGSNSSNNPPTEGNREKEI